MKIFLQEYVMLKQANSELYLQMLKDIKIVNTERIVNEGEIDYQCDYFTIYYHNESKLVGLMNVKHCSCNETEDPNNFDDDEIYIVETIEEFYNMCILYTCNFKEYNKKYKFVYGLDDVAESYIAWYHNYQRENGEDVKYDELVDSLTKL